MKKTTVFIAFKSFALGFLLISFASCKVSDTKIAALVKNYGTKRAGSYEYIVYNKYYNETIRKDLVRLTVSQKEMVKWFNKHPQYVFKGTSVMGTAGFKNQVPFRFSYILKTEMVAFEQEQKIEHCKNEIDRVLSHSIMSLCPKLNVNDIYYLQSLCSACRSNELVERAYFNLIPLCMDREAYVKYFPSGNYTATVKRQIDDIKAGRKKDEAEIVMNYITGVANNTKEMVTDAIKNTNKWGAKIVTNSDYEIVEKSNVQSFTLTKTTQNNTDYATDRFQLSVGCNNYTHKLDKENDGFIASVISKNKTFTTTKDISNQIDILNDSEIKLSNSDLAGEIIVTISFSNNKGNVSLIKFKLKKGGYYRIEIFPE